jgi:UDP-N-acetylglucosamine--N-acetylmuramyl-(pentapeptide) pyrophosphoryl-undecaprenol N-acetylglucosamine transferase
MTIVMTGAGSGGHITPIQAVAAELKKLKPKAHIVYIGQRGDALGDIPAADPNFDQIVTVRAGKFRRYHGEGLRQLLDIKTGLKNIRDVFYVIIGIWQSYRYLEKNRPDVIFIKGGYVGVPVGLAAAALHIPFITHDSDAIPGLANRIIGRWAKVHAVALPKEIYSYPADQTITTGIPLVGAYSLVTLALKLRYREEIKISPRQKMIFIIGGGLGSQIINLAISETIPHLLNEFKDLIIIHGVGRAHEERMTKLYQDIIPASEQGRVRVYGYLSDLYRYSGAADVVITRAGATNVAEFAVQGKACVVIPSPFLAGGHQLKNAKILADRGAALVIDESELAGDPNRLAKQVSSLLKDTARQKALGEQLATLAKPEAAYNLTMVLLDVVAASAAQ